MIDQVPGLKQTRVFDSSSKSRFVSEILSTKEQTQSFVTACIYCLKIGLHTITTRDRSFKINVFH